MEEIVKHLDIPTSLKEFNVPAEDLEGLVEAGMSVQRLLVNNMAPSPPTTPGSCIRKFCNIHRRKSL